MKRTIIRIPMGKSNSYLIKGEDGYILVDAGMPGKIETIERTLNDCNANFSDINLIIITHVHNDHVGSLYDIKKKSKASVLIHEKEKKTLNKGYNKFPDGTMFFSKIISSIANNLFFSKDQFKPVNADIVISDEYNLSDHGVDGRIIHTPGHTEGSISVILQDEYCIIGDTLFNMLPNSVYPPFANDQDELLKSWNKLREYNCIKYYPGHGKEFGLAKFDKTIQKYIIGGE
ncbi:MBL fold metallo-hydrolase [Sporohalobacter salinus]|uniref:MBL fold metallo-hydrolase n=1 Tax=Sporohalobacter salinus TaxID=1494606 RepID=UPI00195F56EF|nr:MBL fold metallo-hydrolase [Sporohalobacter salinus]MBM7624240.1 glyoxylase-like metal-dependent hydrolase (beta-lactamase superfamily II) [Sporohalobacter salinus]